MEKFLDRNSAVRCSAWKNSRWFRWGQGCVVGGPFISAATGCDAERQLQDAHGTLQFACRQEHSEIQVVREDNVVMFHSVLQNLRIRRGNVANRRPVNSFVSMTRQEQSPQRTQVHVDQEFHAAGRGTSISSTRQAA
jgi:hypothetical protein